MKKYRHNPYTQSWEFASNSDILVCNPCTGLMEFAPLGAVMMYNSEERRMEFTVPWGELRRNAYTKEMEYFDPHFDSPRIDPDDEHLEEIVYNATKGWQNTIINCDLTQEQAEKISKGYKRAEQEMIAAGELEPVEQLTESEMVKQITEDNSVSQK